MCYIHCFATLNVHFHEDVISQILHDGKSLGFVYFYYENGIRSRCIEIENKLVKYVIENKKLQVTYKELDFYLEFNEVENNATQIALKDYRYIWDKEFVHSGRIHFFNDYRSGFDVSRYIKTLILLCSNFPIIELKKENSA
jgi:hypothetical protein